MRILGVTETCDLGSLYLRLIEEGHDVRVTVSEPLAQDTMIGMVPRAADWRAELAWVREAGGEGIVLFEATGFGALQDELRGQGFNVIGGSALGDRLENDRAFGQDMLRRIGLRPTPYAEFSSADDALADLAERPRRTVFKLNASAGETFVGEFDDGSDIAALIATPVARQGDSFILMDFIAGIETGVGAYFDGTRFLRPACIDWEHKRFFPGDLGELTGEMGTVASYRGSDRLFETCLAPLEPMLREAGHVGYVNLNTIINEYGVWPLEFTCRFGYPGFAILETLQDCGWGELFARMVAPTSSPHQPTVPGFAMCVVLTTPPFPWSLKEVASTVGLPVRADGVEPEHLHWGEVGRPNGTIVTTGLYGWTAVVTGTGATIEQAQQAAYRRAAQVRCPTLRFRPDIGDRLIGADLAQLKQWGWFNP